jgi:hypothetical protein
MNIWPAEQIPEASGIRQRKSPIWAGEVCGLGHDTGLGIEFQLDLDLVAGLHTGGLSVGVA